MASLPEAVCAIRQPPSSLLHEIDPNRNPSTYFEATNEFLVTIGSVSAPIIHKVSAIVNTDLLAEFIAKEEQMRKHEHNLESWISVNRGRSLSMRCSTAYCVAVRLFHGTSRACVTPITRSGFDPALVLRGRYGQGAYFAQSSSYAAHDAFAAPDERHHKFMFVVSVLVTRKR